MPRLSPNLALQKMQQLQLSQLQLAKEKPTMIFVIFMKS